MNEHRDRMPRTFVVGDWHIDGNSLTASRNDETRSLEPKALRVLNYLHERPGELIKIDELMDAHWSGTVVTPNAVSRVIAQLRKTLDDDAKNPRYIETVAREGYRYIAAPAAAADSKAGFVRAAFAVAAVSAMLIAAVLYWYPVKPVEPSVAVLPFQNLSGRADSDYISDGIAEEIIHSLTKIQPLRVQSQLRSFQYRGDTYDLNKIARELEVNFIVTGTVRWQGSKLLMSAQLIETESGQNLHSVRGEYDVADFFAGQNFTSQEISNALLAAAGLPAQPVTAAPSAPPGSKAYDLYLRGRHIWRQRGIEPLQGAIDNFREAVALDPEFARGWAALATAYLTYPSYSPRGYRTWYMAEDAARKALQLDPSIGEAYSVLATFAHTRFE